MKDLLRGLAPISAAAWEEIDEEARRALKLTLAGRKLVDFAGPLGWDASAVSLGRADPTEPAPQSGVQVRVRRIQPLIELRVPFQLSRLELEAIGRGGKDADLQPVIDAARTIAMAEDAIIFRGYEPIGLDGMGAASSHETLALTDDYERYPKVVATALSKLRNAGVAGPYGIALGPRCYTGLTETTTVGGFRVFDHVQRLLDGPVVWAPGFDGAMVVSLRGGDFELTVGQDLSIGYLEHTAADVRLYIQESITFRVLAPEAAVRLAYGVERSGGGTKRRG
jgi:uncharacterized linocin/CFP29 family protein